jgi:hypothetical protein
MYLVSATPTKCKFHKNPISGLGGVALTRYMDGQTGRFLYTPQTSFAGGIITSGVMK